MSRRRQTPRTIPYPAAGTIDRVGLEAYRVVAELARGGMSTVYLGEDVATGERVAIKMLDAFHLGHGDLVHRLLGEHELARRARHPGLVEVRCADQTALGIPYLVMEYLQGENLRALYDRRALPCDAILAVAAQVASACAALHAAGVVHCDLKPDNVFVLHGPDLADRPRVKVIDYGVARSIHDPVVRDRTVAGTPAYMAPEQWSGSPVAGSDVYALGAMLYELVTGRPVFLGSLPQLMTAHCEQPPLAPAALCSELAAEVDHLILRMLGKDPAVRPTMLEVDAALSRRLSPALCAAG